MGTRSKCAGVLRHFPPQNTPYITNLRLANYFLPKIRFTIASTMTAPTKATSRL